MTSQSKAVETRPARQDLEGLLELRKKIKSRSPEFQRFESWRYVRIHEPWRKPKGVDNHTRLSVNGWPPLVKVGYRGPKKVRGLHPSGYRDVLVHNMSELLSISPKTDAARLAHGLGKRKKIELAKKAKELRIRVLNGRGLLTGIQTSDEEKEGSEKGSEK
jgi:large subunit ribosomal protein L32e